MTQALAAAWLASLLLGQACASAIPETRPAPPPVSLARLAGIPTHALAAYRAAGFLVADEPFPLVGMVHALASASPDSTLVFVTFSLPNRALTFTRAGEQYHAAYRVAIEFRRDSVVVLRLAVHETVRVESFRETSRGEESVIFQHFFMLAPGSYAVSLRASDSTSGRFALTRALLDVPRYANAGTSAPIAVYDVQPRARRGELPGFVPNARNTAVFGRDSVLLLYVESYGPEDSAQLPLRVLDSHKRLVAADSVRLTRREELLAGIARLSVARLGLGSMIAELHTTSGAVARIPILVSLGEGLAATSFEEMLEYLRYYTTSDQLRALRDATVEARPKAWVEFLRQTDPNPSTAEHEGLSAYFHRLTEANARFRDEGIPGWLTERGMVYATLGEPDNIFDPSGPGAFDRGRRQVWEYLEHRIRLVFYDPTGFGRWRLTPTSEADFAVVARRLQVR